MKPGTYQDIMERISRGKHAELVRSAKLPFTQKLALSAGANRGQEPLMLSESFGDPVLERHQLEGRWRQLLEDRAQSS